MRWLQALVLVSLVLPACGRGEKAPAAGAAGAPESPAVRPSTRPTILFLGTSLTAGLGLDPGQAYPAVIQWKIDSAGLDYHVINAGVSGETSAGSLSRIGWLLRNAPRVLVIETGANDGLRGLDPDSMKANIQAIVDSARARVPGIVLLLVAMEAPRNLGAEYVRRFQAVFPDLARRNGITLIPFLLDGVAGIDSLNQEDGIHPTAAGARIVAGNVWRVLAGVLRSGG